MTLTLNIVKHIDLYIPNKHFNLESESNTTLTYSLDL